MADPHMDTNRETEIIEVKIKHLPPGLGVVPNFKNEGRGGLVINSTEPAESANQYADLQVQDLIVEINGTDIRERNFLEAQKIWNNEYKKTDELRLKLIRPKQSRLVKHKPPKVPRNAARFRHSSPVSSRIRGFQYSLTSHGTATYSLSHSGLPKLDERVETPESYSCEDNLTQLNPSTSVLEKSLKNDSSADNSEFKTEAKQSIKTPLKYRKRTPSPYGDIQQIEHFRDTHSLSPYSVLDSGIASEASSRSGSGRMIIKSDEEVKKIRSESLWNTCISSGEPSFGYEALREKLYPSQIILNKLYHIFGKHAELTKHACNSICSLIRKKHKTIIVDVWAAVECNNDTIVFVIIVKDKDVALDKVSMYSHVTRHTGFVSQEGKDIIYNKDFDEWWAKVPHTTRIRLRNTISKNNIDLMKDHKYLTMISLSPVRSKGYNTPSPTIKHEACIALYVLIKGYIDIQEDPFEKQYDGIPVDVREGSFSLFYGPPNVFHDSLKSGCQIQREHLGTGTLGGFIDYHGYGTCGLTCAHVLLHQKEMEELLPKPDDAMEVEDAITSHIVCQRDCNTLFQNKMCIVCQPCCNTLYPNNVGKFVTAIYRKGGAGESGFEIAVFQIEKRNPDFGVFPTLKDGTPVNLLYDSGKTADFSRLESKIVLKFGAQSHLTSGFLEPKEAATSVKLIDYESENPYKITLHNLLEVKATDERSCFAEPGDSGALVFCKGENSELKCIGMVEGGTTHNTCVVMPIIPILEQLNLTSLKSFERNRIEHRLDERFTELKDLLLQSFTSLNTRISQLQHDMSCLQERFNDSNRSTYL